VSVVVSNGIVRENDPDPANIGTSALQPLNAGLLEIDLEVDQRRSSLVSRMMVIGKDIWRDPNVTLGNKRHMTS